MIEIVKEMEKEYTKKDCYEANGRDYNQSGFGPAGSGGDYLEEPPSFLDFNTPYKNPTPQQIKDYMWLKCKSDKFTLNLKSGEKKNVRIETNIPPTVIDGISYYTFKDINTEDLFRVPANQINFISCLGTIDSGWQLNINEPKTKPKYGPYSPYQYYYPNYQYKLPYNYQQNPIYQYPYNLPYYIFYNNKKRLKDIYPYIKPIE